MTPDHSHTLSGIFAEAVAISDPDQRQRFVESSCAGNPELFSELSELLEAYEACDRDGDDSFIRPFASLLPRLEEASEELPRSFGRYVLQQQIGQGGMGVVYRAEQLDLKRSVAIKMVRNARLATRKEIRRFYLEAQSAAQLQHPHIVPVFEAGKIDNQHFFSMGYIDGTDISKARKEDLISLPQAIVIMKQLASAVSYAHRIGVIHRDLKPSNILLSINPDANKPVEKWVSHISDFGLAKRAQEHQDLTLDGEIMGTPAYMAPEQASGEHSKIGKTTDIYALGAILYFILTAKAPFQGESPWEILQKVKFQKTSKIDWPVRTIPKKLKALCLRCLEKDPDDRFQKAQELLEALTSIEQLPALHQATSSEAAPSKSATLTKTGIAVGLTILTILGTLFIAQWSKVSNEQEAKGHSMKATAKHLIDPPPAVDIASKASDFDLKAQLTIASKALQQGRSDAALIIYRKVLAQAEEIDAKDFARIARLNLDVIARHRPAIQRIVPTGQTVEHFEVSPQNRYLLTQDEDKSIIVTETLSGNILLKEELADSPTAFSFHPSGESFFVATTLPSIDQYRRESGIFRKVESLKLNQSSDSNFEKISSLHPTLDGTTLHSLHEDGTIAFWDTQTYRLIAPPVRLPNCIGLDIAEQENLLVGISTQGSISAWDAHTAAPIFENVDLGLSEIVSGEVDAFGRQLLVQRVATYETLGFDLSPALEGSKRLAVSFTLPELAQFHPRSTNTVGQNESATLVFRDQLRQEVSTLPESGNPIRLARASAHLFSLDSSQRNITQWLAPTSWANGVSTNETPPYCSVFRDGQISHLFAGHGSIKRSSDAFLRFKTSRYLPNGFIQKFVSDLKRERMFALLSEAHSPDQTHDYWLAEISLETLEPVWQSKPFNQEPVSILVHPDNGLLKVITETFCHCLKPGTEELVSVPLPTREFASTAISSRSNAAFVTLSDIGELSWFSLHGTTVSKIEVNPPELLPSKLMSITADSLSKTLALSDNEGKIYLIDEAKGTLRWQVDTSDKSAHNLCFSTGGDFLVSVAGRKVLILDGFSGEQIGPPLLHPSDVIDAHVSIRSLELVCFTADDKKFSWPLPSINRLPSR